MEYIKEKMYVLKNKLSDILSIYNEFRKAIRNVIVKKKKDETYVGLNPIDNADEDGVYCHALQCALEDKEITNIAIAGNYSSGKSSILKTFFSKLENKKYRPIYISLSLASFRNLETNSNGDENKNEILHSLEKSILQQIFYKEDLKKIPLSRFKRIKKHSILGTLFITIALLMVIYFLLELIVPNFIGSMINNFLNSRFPKAVMIILLCITLIFIVCSVYSIVFLLKNKIVISKVKVSDNEIEVDNKIESIFNKYLDEIIYFFQVHKHRVVIIEDLDRLDGKINVTIIFEKLRELNNLINSSNQVNYEVDFIYAIRDDFFKDAEKRTKFFDMNIPIIPIASNTNSNEIIWNRLQKLEKIDLLKNRLDKSFINKIAFYIDNKRIIDCIINEFIIYKRELKNNYLNDEKLFAMVTYKNLYPDRYSKLQKNEGNIIEIFKDIEVIKLGKLQELKNKRNELIKQKAEIKREELNSVVELKQILVSSVYSYNNSYTQGYFEINGQRVNINDFFTSIRI